MSEHISSNEGCDSGDESGKPGRGMTRRRFLAALGTTTAALAAMGLEACSPEPSPSPSAPTVQPATVASTIAAATSVPAALKSNSVEYWTFLDPRDKNARSEAQNMMLDSFKKKFPNVEVNVTVFASQNIDQQLTQAVKAGNAPDLSRASLLLMAQHAAASDLMPLEQYVSGWSAQQKGQFVTPWDMTAFNGHKLSFFVEARCYPLVYRKDLVKEPPQSWDELGQMGAKLTEPPVYGVGIPLSEKGHASGLYQWFLPALWGAGGEYFTPDGKAAFAGEAGVKAYQLLHDLVQRYRAMSASVASADIEAVVQSMKAGTQVMGVIGTDRIIPTWAGKATTRDQLGVGYVPSFEKGKPSPTFTDGWQVVIPSGAKNPDGAWALMQHILDPESQLSNAKVGGELPSVRAVLDDPWFRSPDGANFGFVLRYLDESKRDVYFPATWNQLMDNLATAAQQVIAGQKSPADALAAVAKEFDGNTGGSSC